MVGDNSFVVVANRLPVDLVYGQWVPSPGGLVAALEPVLQAHHGCWVGWPGVVDAAMEPFHDRNVLLHPVPLDQQDYEQFYEGFSNATLWPLFHDLIVPPVYDQSWWETYRSVNEKFATEVAAVAADNATVWVQDYQLLLVPGLLREMRPDLTIGFFLHIPFPSPDLFRQLPWRAELIAGLHGADLVGFQRSRDEENFRAIVDADITTGTFPISIDPSTFGPVEQEIVAKLREQLGSPHTVLLGVDRLDYTKGILQRLTALEELYDEGQVHDVTFIQIATPSRERIDHYQQTRSAVEEAVGRINGRFGEIGRPVVHYYHRQMQKAQLRNYYAAADIMLVTPFKDGMNLVAKEYVACHPEGNGALVLSEFAGAAVELHKAHLCNPFDTESIKSAILDAISAQGSEAARTTMQELNQQVNDFTVARWAETFLNELNATRSRAGKENA
ncbi:trehalose-6-phosphate synthase [Corynebacterium breve]|uniref:alpha,alpha-trehalose-phosphate synthase (ADP-forming) n=1 Tax=Corynebacterium breve TaxID=3049799 RepID=A0ABY8VEZ8_9CORY|nr:trehalose-6-phosphate synthase [Corynebacterium breve]WIM67330.1 trehalose-6-phosphate synthase [Corynebacterium breve]